MASDDKHDYRYEYKRPDGSIQIYRGHPGYCMNPERHKLHLFMYEFRHWDGSPEKGQYVCDGSPAEYPERWIDQQITDAL